MKLDNAVEIIKPAPDSHFRLLPCKCGSDNVAYILDADERWHVHCFDCGCDGASATVRHEAQVRWNKEGDNAMNFKFSCHGCQKRSPGCHGSCETYKKEKICYDEQKAEIDKQKAIRDGVYCQRSNAVSKAMNRRG